MMRLNVNNVHQVKQQRWKVPLNVILVMLEILAKPRVFVQNARLDFIKTREVKSNVFNVNWENSTSIPEQHAMVVTLVRMAVQQVCVRPVRLASTKTAKKEQHAVLLLLVHPEKYPTTNVLDVNYHHGERAK